jgi:5-methylcytosine-specific restriction protein A
MLMPSHRCPKCQRLITGRCSHCEQTRDQARPNAASRGYCSARWRRFRAIQLALQPLCGECLRGGVNTPATEVDHIRPVSGPNDITFLSFRHVQSLCHVCHSRKTVTEDSTFVRRR